MVLSYYIENNITRVSVPEPIVCRMQVTEFHFPLILLWDINFHLLFLYCCFLFTADSFSRTSFNRTLSFNGMPKPSTCSPPYWQNSTTFIFEKRASSSISTPRSSFLSTYIRISLRKTGGQST